VLQGAIRAALIAVQVREKQMQGCEMIAHVGEVIDIARPAGVLRHVNDRADVALTAGADGVPLVSPISASRCAPIAGRNLVVGVSYAQPGRSPARLEDGADYCGVGAMFASSTKDDSPRASPICDPL